MTLEKAIVMRRLAAVLLTLLAACAHDVSLDRRPERVWASSKSMNAAASCVIRILNDRGRSGSSLAPTVTHARRVIEPGKVYEIRPERELAVTTEAYTVRLEKIDDRITRISLFASSPWEKELIKALSPCGARS